MAVAPAPTFVVVDTHWVVPPRRFHEAPYLEIVVGQSHDPDCARVTLITRDLALVAHVVALEGSDTRVGLTWRHEPSATRRRNVLEAVR
jgi:hypothetical protein